jgi:hypothetical protein
LAKNAPHFDVAALCDAVLEQPIGLRVSTNHPAGFRRLLYHEARRNPARRLQILQSPDSAVMFLLVKPAVDIATFKQEPSDDQAV